MYDPYANFVTRFLSNGVPVYVLYEPGRSFALLNFMFQSGMRDDMTVPCGTAHFLEHMICANSGMSLTERQQFFGLVGGFYHAVTGYESTRYGFKAPIMSDVFDARLDFWAEACLDRPLVDHFSREKTVITSEIERRYPTVQMMDLSTKVMQIHFRGLPWSGAPSAAGTLESVARITPDDVEQFRQTYYSTNNLTLVCVGGLTPEQVVEKLNRTGVAQSMTGVRNPLPVTMTALPPLAETEMVAHLNADAPMGRATLQYQTLLPATVTDAATECAVHMLTDLLYFEVREKRGLAYKVSAASNLLGPFRQMFLDISDFPEQHVAEVTKVAEGLMHSFVSERTLFEQKKSEALAHFLTRDANLQMVWQAASNELMLQGHIKSAAEEIAELVALRFEDLLQIAEELHRPGNLLRVTVYR